MRFVIIYHGEWQMNLVIVLVEWRYRRLASKVASMTLENLELVPLKSHSSVPLDIAEELLSGVPRGIVGGGYLALGQAVMSSVDLVQFASDETGWHFCIQVPSGHVLVVNDDDSEDRMIVNANLESFRRSVAVFNSAYPFYSREDDSERWGMVASDLERLLAEVGSQIYHRMNDAGLKAGDVVSKFYIS
jgi:hypothetical protein